MESNKIRDTKYDEFFTGQVNKLIQSPEVDKSLVTDGYHTFGELYEHRNRLFMAIIDILHDYSQEPIDVWKSLNHSDGSHYEGYFILGINREKGQQITYHLPIKYWDELTYFVSVLDKAPEYDGHTSNDVLERLKYL
jgi:hypothetical protein